MTCFGELAGAHHAIDHYPALMLILVLIRLLLLNNVFALRLSQRVTATTMAARLGPI